MTVEIYIKDKWRILVGEPREGWGLLWKEDMMELGIYHILPLADWLDEYQIKVHRTIFKRRNVGSLCIPLKEDEEQC